VTREHLVKRTRAIIYFTRYVAVLNLHRMHSAEDEGPDVEDSFSPDGTTLGSALQLACEAERAPKSRARTRAKRRVLLPKRYAAVIREGLTRENIEDLLEAERTMLVCASKVGPLILFYRSMTVWLMIMWTFGIVRLSGHIVESLVKMGERLRSSSELPDFEWKSRRDILLQAVDCRKALDPYIDPVVVPEEQGALE
jgi:hypothetical protein